MKKCARCEREKDLDEFYVDRRGVYSARCRDCHGIAERTCIQCAARFIAKSGVQLCSPSCRTAYRPPTFRSCEQCEETFGPLDHLARRFCSSACKYTAARTGAKIKHKHTQAANRANSRVARLIAAGRLVRPSNCSECGRPGPIEAAHEHYADALAFRWLCRRCHRLWDAGQPKGGTIAVPV